MGTGRSHNVGNGRLQRKRSFKNDGDSGVTVVSGDYSNLQDVTGVPEQRMCSKDIIRRPSSSRECCDTCNEMTGTADGLCGLLDPCGYKHLNWYELQETTSRGCALCQDIMRVLENNDCAYDEDEVVVPGEIRITGSFSQLANIKGGDALGHPLEGKLIKNIWVHMPVDWPYGQPDNPQREAWNVVTFDADPTSSVVPGRREGKDLTSKAVTEIRRWLDECQDKHPSCPSRCNHSLPSRVLDLESQTLRLHQSGPDEKGPYATLSYCWGGVAQLTTTTASLQDHVRTIDPTCLPKTITDAVEVCRAIGLRYLWVDSLCIIQDDDNDKTEQIAGMGLIYKHSTLTIVAASAHKVTDGFLRDGKPIQPVIQLPFYVDQATTGTVYLRWRDPSEASASADSEPIFQRAWTYQEQLLSPRALVFDSNQILLKCLTDDYRPVFETYLEMRTDAPKLPNGVFDTVGKNLERGDASQTREYYNMATQDETWRLMVCNYSRRELSRFSDRLPALAGIAAELAVVWDDIYLAGFWGRTILHHLGWYRPRLMGSRCITEAFEENPFEGMVDCKRRAAGPTWSWATAPFPVWMHRVQNPDPKLVSSSVQLISQKSPFGQVRSASITLEAKVLNAAAALREFTAGAEEYPLGSIMRVLLTWPPAYELQDLIMFDFEEPHPDVELCSLVYLGGSYGGLFLYVEQTEPGRYRRVGCALLPDDTAHIWQDLLNVAQREIIVID